MDAAVVVVDTPPAATPSVEQAVSSETVVEIAHEQGVQEAEIAHQQEEIAETQTETEILALRVTGMETQLSSMQTEISSMRESVSRITSVLEQAAEEVEPEPEAEAETMVEVAQTPPPQETKSKDILHRLVFGTPRSI